MEKEIYPVAIVNNENGSSYILDSYQDKEHDDGISFETKLHFFLQYYGKELEKKNGYQTSSVKYIYPEELAYYNDDEYYVGMDGKKYYRKELLEDSRLTKRSNIICKFDKVMSELKEKINGNKIM